ncbi:MAG: hypothetical protein ACO1OX_15170 [Novosphingobium sp.]
MLNLLAAIMLSTGTPHTAQPHHGFRLPQPTNDKPSQDQRCSADLELTVCARQGDGPRLTTATSEIAPPRHHAVLRLAPSRCTNPVENGLRCVLPVTLVRVNLDD